MWHHDRHRQLLETAELLLSKDGWDGLLIPELATAAGVTRPIIYKHFRNRRDLIVQLVRGYADELQATLHDAVRKYPDRLDVCLRLTLDRLCGAIESRGAGAWNLLAAGGPDPEINQVMESLRTEMMRPWIPRIRKVTGATLRQAQLLCHLTFALVRTVIERWEADELSRREAERTLMRGIGALLREFSDEARALG
jgi:AcrR family transcriptional regulator